MIKLNDNNIFVGQIKQLLHTFPLPQCQVGSAYPQSNAHFITRDYIMRWDANLTPIKSSHYVFGNEYLNLTATLPIRNIIYDRETHRYLGKYLRFLRDYFNVNLMSMYNCCDNDINTNPLKFTSERTQEEISFTDGDDSCTVYKIPISVSPFTISSHSLNTTEICVYVDNAREEYQDLIADLARVTYIKRKASCIHYSPFATLIDPKLKTFALEHLDELCLLVKITEDLKTSLVVLEGTYSEKTNSLQKVFSYKPMLSTQSIEANTSLLALIEGSIEAARQNAAYVITDPDSRYAELLAADGEVLLAKGDIGTYIADAVDSGFNIQPQLLSYNNATSNGLLGDRLIEYLTGNVISPLSEHYDIKRLQLALDIVKYESPILNSDIKNLSKYKQLYKDVLPKHIISKDRYYGIWHDSDFQGLKAIVAAHNMHTEEYDVLGYLDKKVETVLKEIIDNVEL